MWHATGGSVTALSACMGAETARTDRIGKGFVPQIQPLTGVLAKILQRKEEAIKRCLSGAELCPLLAVAKPSSNHVHDCLQCLADG